MSSNLLQLYLHTFSKSPVLHLRIIAIIDKWDKYLLDLYEIGKQKFSEIQSIVWFQCLLLLLNPKKSSVNEHVNRKT